MEHQSSKRNAYPISRRIEREYNELVTASSISLLELFETDNDGNQVVQLQGYCKQWTPHPNRAEIVQNCKNF
jgi:hypothetical protein